MTNRSRLQREADALDCDADRLYRRIEATLRYAHDAERELGNALRDMSQVRSSLRQLMHPDDRKATQ